MNKNVKEVIKMNSKLILPVIIFLTMFIIIIIILLVIQNKRKNKFKKTIEELDYEKNRLIGVPILSELSKVRELVKTDNLKQKLSDWDDEFKDLKENKINILTDLITEADFLIERKDYKNALKKIANIEINLDALKKKTENLLEDTGGVVDDFVDEVVGGVEFAGAVDDNEDFTGAELVGGACVVFVELVFVLVTVGVFVRHRENETAVVRHQGCAVFCREKRVFLIRDIQHRLVVFTEVLDFGVRDFHAAVHFLDVQNRVAFRVRIVRQTVIHVHLVVLERNAGNFGDVDKERSREDPREGVVGQPAELFVRYLADDVVAEQVRCRVEGAVLLFFGGEDKELVIFKRVRNRVRRVRQTVLLEFFLGRHEAFHGIAFQSNEIVQDLEVQIVVRFIVDAVTAAFRKRVGHLDFRDCIRILLLIVRNTLDVYKQIFAVPYGEVVREEVVVLGHTCGQQGLQENLRRLQNRGFEGVADDVRRVTVRVLHVVAAFGHECVTDVHRELFAEGGGYRPRCLRIVQTVFRELFGRQIGCHTHHRGRRAGGNDQTGEDFGVKAQTGASFELERVGRVAVNLVAAEFVRDFNGLNFRTFKRIENIDVGGLRRHLNFARKQFLRYRTVIRYRYQRTDHSKIRNYHDNEQHTKNDNKLFLFLNHIQTTSF